MKVIITDLDGTVNDCRHRIDYAKVGLWDDFHSRLEDDSPNTDVLWFLSVVDSWARLASGDVSILAVTGRNERYRNQTLTWLSKYEAKIDDLLMRPDDNFTHDHELKIAMILEWFRGDKEAMLENVILVLEDREKVVEAMRNFGLKVWQVRPGEY